MRQGFRISYFIFLQFCWSIPVLSFATNPKVDSLRKCILASVTDTQRIRNLNELGYLIHTANPDSAIMLERQADSIEERLLPSASGKLKWILQQNKANSMVSIGDAYFVKSDYTSAIKYTIDGLKLYEQIGDSANMASCANNLGDIYNRQGNYKLAVEYFYKAMAVQEAMGNKPYVAIAAGNLGETYESMNNHEMAIKYLTLSKKMSEELNDEDGISICLLNIGNVYDNKGNIDSALYYYLKALPIKEKTGDKEGIAICYDNMGKDYFVKKEYNEAIQYLLKSEALARQIGEKVIVQDVYANFARGYVQMKDYKKAYEYLNKYSDISDTIFNEHSAQQIAQVQAQYDTEKKQKQIELLKKDKEKQAAVAEAELRKKRVILFSSIAIILLLAGFAFFMVNRFVVIRKQKVVIEEQKALVDEKNTKLEEAKAIVEEKNKDILDSITYAKRLQDAILPPLSLVKQYLPDSFLLYKPKDIVAGDFYWMWSGTTSRHSSSGEIQEDIVLIAAADCTGHGVPGAMVSVVCSNALNRTVKEFKITESGKILDKVRELVLETFEKSEDNVQDGMDISLCCINTKTREAQWSGAYNSLWYIRNGEVVEVPADKQPIGKVDRPIPFNTHNLNLQKGDTLYLFTDGYADQFGGPKGKKFKYKQLEELLLTNVAKPMEEQKGILESTLNDWRGELEQVDDVLIIGIRV